jgi:hypothetical protein
MTVFIFAVSRAWLTDETAVGQIFIVGRVNFSQHRMGIKILRLNVSIAFAKAAEQILFHDIQVLKHGALGFGHVMPLNGFEDMLVPTMGHFMPPGAHGFYLGFFE